MYSARWKLWRIPCTLRARTDILAYSASGKYTEKLGVDFAIDRARLAAFYERTARRTDPSDVNFRIFDAYGIFRNTY